MGESSPCSTFAKKAQQRSGILHGFGLFSRSTGSTLTMTQIHHTVKLVLVVAAAGARDVIVTNQQGVTVAVICLSIQHEVEFHHTILDKRCDLLGIATATST